MNRRAAPRGGDRIQARGPWRRARGRIGSGGRRLRVIGATVLTAIGGAGCGAAALQTAPAPRHLSAAARTVVFDCAGRAAVRPRMLTLYCADAGQILSNVRWQGWGTATASGRADIDVNSCTPTCVAGHTVVRSARLVATDLALAGTSATYETLVVDTAGSVSRFSLTVNGPVPR